MKSSEKNLQLNLDTVTFVDYSETSQYTVRRSFLEICPNPRLYGPWDLHNKFSIQDYLHNPEGPAVVDLVTKECRYFLDGKELSKEHSERLIHNQSFKRRVDTFLRED